MAFATDAMDNSHPRPARETACEQFEPEILSVQVRLTYLLPAMLKVITVVLNARVHVGDLFWRRARNAAHGVCLKEMTDLVQGGMMAEYYQMKYAAALEGQWSLFDSRDEDRNPSVASYLERISYYGGVSNSVFLVMLIYIDRLNMSCPELTLTTRNVHRILAASFVIATKWLEDRHPGMAMFGHVLGVGVDELERLEEAFLKLLRYRTHVTAEQFAAYETAFIAEAMDSTEGMHILHLLGNWGIEGIDAAVEHSKSWQFLEERISSPISVQSDDVAVQEDATDEDEKRQARNLPVLDWEQPAKLRGLATAQLAYDFPAIQANPAPGLEWEAERQVLGLCEESGLVRYRKLRAIVANGQAADCELPPLGSRAVPFEDGGMGVSAVEQVLRQYAAGIAWDGSSEEEFVEESHVGEGQYEGFGGGACVETTPLVPPGFEHRAREMAEKAAHQHGYGQELVDEPVTPRFDHHGGQAVLPGAPAFEPIEWDLHGLERLVGEMVDLGLGEVDQAVGRGENGMFTGFGRHFGDAELPGLNCFGNGNRQGDEVAFHDGYVGEMQLPGVTHFSAPFVEGAGSMDGFEQALESNMHEHLLNEGVQRREEWTRLPGFDELVGELEGGRGEHERPFVPGEANVMGDIEGHMRGLHRAGLAGFENESRVNNVEAGGLPGFEELVRGIDIGRGNGVENRESERSVREIRRFDGEGGAEVESEALKTAVACAKFVDDEGDGNWVEECLGGGVIWGEELLGGNEVLVEEVEGLGGGGYVEEVVEVVESVEEVGMQHGGLRHEEDGFNVCWGDAQVWGMGPVEMYGKMLSMMCGREYEMMMEMVRNIEGGKTSRTEIWEVWSSEGGGGFVGRYDGG